MTSGPDCCTDVLRGVKHTHYEQAAFDVLRESKSYSLLKGS